VSGLIFQLFYLESGLPIGIITPVDENQISYQLTIVRFTIHDYESRYSKYDQQIDPHHLIGRSRILLLDP
jgi:hypothetical protein